MKYETLRELTLPKIGFGTWKIGGESFANPQHDAASLAALRSALELGYTHFDTAEMYANGHAEELLGQSIRELRHPREKLFIASKVLPSHLRYAEVIKACENSLRRLQMGYLDLYLIHWPSSGMKLPDTFKALNELVTQGKVKHLGVSNFNLALLKEAQTLSATPLLTNQVPYSLADRAYVKNGVLAYCQQQDILVTAYSPVQEGHWRPPATVQGIAANHHATAYQIALAWLAQQTRVITIPMSANPKHQAENLAAAEIELTPHEMQSLTTL